MDSSSMEREVSKYKKFKKVDGATYRKVNQFLRKRTYITAREWALARLCTDFRTSGGAEMTFIGKNLPQLVPFMEDTYTPQAVNQARNSFKKKVRKASATFFYGAMCGFFTTDELDDLLFEASEVSRFLLEVEGTTLDIDEEIDIEDRITKVMRDVGEAAKTILKTRHADIEQEGGGPEAPTVTLPELKLSPDTIPVRIGGPDQPAVPDMSHVAGEGSPEIPVVFMMDRKEGADGLVSAGMHSGSESVPSAEAEIPEKDPSPAMASASSKTKNDESPAGNAGDSP